MPAKASRWRICIVLCHWHVIQQGQVRLESSAQACLHLTNAGLNPQVDHMRTLCHWQVSKPEQVGAELPAQASIHLAGLKACK